MNKVLLALPLLLVSSVGAQHSPEHEAEWAKVRPLKALYEEVVTSGDVEKLRPFCAKDFRGVLLTGRAFNGFDDFVAATKEIKALIGEGGSYKTELNYTPGSMFDDTAIVQGTAMEHVVTGAGKRFDFESRWIANLVREDGAWKLFRIQSTMDPADNVFTRAGVQTTAIAVGAGAGLLGMILGYAASALRKR